MDLDITDFSRKWRFSCEETFFTANSYIFREMCVFVNKKNQFIKDQRSSHASFEGFTDSDDSV